MSELKRPAGSFEGRIGISPSNNKGTKQIIITADKDTAKQIDEFFFSHGIIAQVENYTEKKLLLRIDMK